MAFRLVKELRPDWCVFENVAGHINMGLDVAECEFCGYEFDEICGRYGCPNCLGGEFVGDTESERSVISIGSWL